MDFVWSAHGVEGCGGRGNVCGECVGCVSGAVVGHSLHYVIKCLIKKSIDYSKKSHWMN